MKAALEGLLFISGDEGLDINQITNILDIDIIEAKNIIKQLYNDLLSSERGIKLEFLGEKFKLTTKTQHAKYYEKLVNSEQESKLSQSGLEVLSIIAYNQPISRVEIDQIRGVNSTYIVRKLVLKNLIVECGKSNEPGRPLLYKVTDQFLNYFGLGTIKDLPNVDKKEIITNNNTDIFDTKYKEIE